MKMFTEFYAALGISATTVAEIEVPTISATTVGELKIEENHPSSTVAIISDPLDAEMQICVYDLVTSVCWMQNRIILEKCKDLMGVATCDRYSQLPEEYTKYLPSEEELNMRLSELIPK